MSRFRKPSALSSILSEVTEDLGISARLADTRVEETWLRIAGPQAARVTRRVKKQGAKLTVYLTDATWRHALHAQREDWRLRLNEALETEAVEELVFR